MNGLMEGFAFDLQLFANGEPSFDPWGSFEADSSDAIEDVSTEDIKSSDTDADDLADGDVVWSEDASTIVEGDTEKTTVKVDMSKVQTQEVTQSDGTVVTITVIPTSAIAGGAVDTSDGSANVSFGTGANATKFDIAEGSNVTVNFGQDANGDYTGEPESVTTAAGDTTIGIGGSSGVGLGITGASSGATIGLKNGRPSFLGFVGNLAFTLYRALTGAADANYTPDTTSAGATITFEGFNENVDNNYVSLSDNGKEVVSINMANREDATVEVTGTYDYTLIVHESDDNETQVSSEAFDLDNVTDTSVYTFTVLSNDGLQLDLRDVVASNTSKPVSLAEAGGVDAVLPPTAADGGSIKISGTTYEYTTVANSEGGFLLDSEGEATAFFLSSTGDSFRVGADSDFLVYDSDDLTTSLNSEVTASGGDLVFTKTAAGYNLGYVFTSVGDTITVNEEQGDTLELFYKNKRVEYDIVEPTEIDGGYTVTMTATNTFVISALEAEADVVVAGAGLTFEEAGGSVTVVATPNTTAGTATLAITGITVESGTVEFDDNAAALLENGFTINGETLKIADMEAFTYNADTGEVESDGLVYAIGDGMHTFNNGSYVVADNDGAVVFAVDANGNVTAITNLNKGTVTGDFSGDVTVNGQDIATDDILLTITGEEGATGIDAIDGLNGNVTLAAAADLTINGDEIVVAAADTVVATGNETADGVASLTGAASGDAVTVGADTAVVLPTDGTAANISVNGTNYAFTNDEDGVTITGAGAVTGLDEDATLTLDKATAVTVNGVTYSEASIKSALANGEAIVGYTKKDGSDASYMEDVNHLIINGGTTAAEIMYNVLGVPVADSVVTESVNFADTVTSYDFTTTELEGTRTHLYLDSDDKDADVIFNDRGKNVAIVDGIENSTKNITLGNKDDVVIVTAGTDDKYSKVNITGGTGDDTVVVQGEVPVTFDMSKGGADKLITYAAANAKVTINGYDETTGAGIVIHEPEAGTIAQAIEGDLLMFENGTVVTIDRDEDAAGNDRKTEVTVTDANLVRMYTYKDTKDTYTDDGGQLVGFTGKSGGLVDASDKTENVILVGNKNGKYAASSLVGGSGDDTVYAGKGDTVNAGDGENVVNITGGAGANIVVSEGDTTINGLTTGFSGDVLGINDIDEVSFDGSNLIVEGDGYSATASVTTATSVNQLFELNNETIKAVVAADGQDISVSGNEVPEYFIGNAGVDFSDYSGEVIVNADGSGSVGGNTAYFSDNITSLKGGSGNTQFIGGSENDYLVAGSGATSLYGGAGNNTLVGYSGTDKKAATEFFVMGNEAGASTTIQNFQFGTDLINTDFASNYISKVTVDGGDVVLRVTNRSDETTTETAVIEGGVDAGNIQIGTRGNVVAVGQIGSDEVTVDGKADYLAATVAGGATVNVSSALTEKTGIWLDGRGDKWFSDNFAVIDATASSAELELAGDYKANTIMAGSGNASLWGGSGNANDLLVGGTGHNSFYYQQGDGADTINNANDGDVVSLFDTSLDNILSADITSTGVVVNFNNGGSLTVNSNNDVTYQLSDGSTWSADHTNKTWSKKS